MATHAADSPRLSPRQKSSHPQSLAARRAARTANDAQRDVSRGVRRFRVRASPRRSLPMAIWRWAAGLPPFSVLGADVAGEAGLNYTWSVTREPAGGNVSFAANGTNAAKNSVATFNEAGTYVLMVTITDASDLSVTGTSTVTVNQTLTSIRLSDGSTKAVISPTAPDTVTGSTEPLVAQGLDQFGNVLTSQPAFTWSTTTVPSGAAPRASRPAAPPRRSSSARPAATELPCKEPATGSRPAPRRRSWSSRCRRS